MAFKYLKFANIVFLVMLLVNVYVKYPVLFNRSIIIGMFSTTVVLLLLSLILLIILGACFKYFGSDRYARYTFVKKKGVFTYFMDNNVFVYDIFFWLFLLGFIYANNVHDYNSVKDMVITRRLFVLLQSTIPLYMVFGAWENMKKLF